MDEPVTLDSQGALINPEPMTFETGLARERQLHQSREGMTDNVIAVNQTKEDNEREEEAMAQQDTGSGLLTDITNSIVSSMREIAARSIDANVSFAKQMLDYQAQTTSWAKDTPMGPMFQSQHALGEGLIELFAGAARAMWRIEKPKAES
jgi:hypothetical protein